MKGFMLDTNTVSQLLRAQPQVTKRVLAAPIPALCISAITEGELMFGLARRPEATRLHALVSEFLRRVDVLPWNSEVAHCYGELRAALEQKGVGVGSLDLLIAAHAAAAEAVLVTSDRALLRLPGVSSEDWSV